MKSIFYATFAAALAIPAMAQNANEPLQKLDQRLTQAAYLSESDLLSDEAGPRYLAARAFIRTKQCAARNANPMVFVSLPVNMYIKATIGPSGAATASAADRDGPIELPLRVSTVSNFPNEYLKDMTTFLQTKGLPEEVEKKLRGELAGNYDKLYARVQALLNSFDPRNCTAPPASQPPPPMRLLQSEIIYVPIYP
jgi:hypothetical protein